MEILNGLIVESVTRDGFTITTKFTNGYTMDVSGGSADGYGFCDLTIYDENFKIIFEENYPN